jgi:hypothetical protein
MVDYNSRPLNLNLNEKLLHLHLMNEISPHGMLSHPNFQTLTLTMSMSPHG